MQSLSCHINPRDGSEDALSIQCTLANKSHHILHPHLWFHTMSFHSLGIDSLCTTKHVDTIVHSKAWGNVYIGINTNRAGLATVKWCQGGCPGNTSAHAVYFRAATLLGLTDCLIKPVCCVRDHQSRCGAHLVCHFRYFAWPDICPLTLPS